MEREDILTYLKEVKQRYEKEGFIIKGLFGSHARDSADLYSDIDLVYELDYEKFDKVYHGGFSKLLKIEDIKDELQNTLKRRVDLIPLNKKDTSFYKIIKDELIYV